LKLYCNYFKERESTLLKKKDSKRPGKKYFQNLKQEQFQIRKLLIYILSNLPISCQTLLLLLRDGFSKPLASSSAFSQV